MSDQSRATSPSEIDSGSEIQLSHSFKSDQLLTPQSTIMDALKESFNNDLHERIRNAEEKNLLLSVENEILEKYLMKVDPTLIQGMEKLLEKVNEKMAKAQIITQSLEPISRAGSRASQVSKPDSFYSVGPVSSFSASGVMPASESLKIPHISYEFRHDIVNREMNSMKSKLDKLIVRMKREKTHIAACAEELALRIEDLREFKKKLTFLSNSTSPSKINLETYLRFTKSMLKQINQNINQAKTNMTILSIEKKKVLLRMEDKQELSSTIYPIDFDILEIQNQELRKQLKLKCRDLSITKRSLCTTERSLLTRMDNFRFLCRELKNFKRKVGFNQMKIKNLKRKQKMLELEIKQRKKETCYEIPCSEESKKNIAALDVMSYAFTKLCLGDLERKLKINSRKRRLKLALLNCMRYNFKLMAMRTPMNSKKSWFL